MTTKYTPAPWYVIPDPAWVGKHPCHNARFIATCPFSAIEYAVTADNPDGSRPWRFENAEDSIICTMPDVENQQANAQLIAAAPELLASCQALLAMVDELLPLAKDGCGWGTIETDEARAVIAKATGQNIPTPAI